MGRPSGPLKGRTAQANALATWLLAITHGVTVRELETAFPSSKSAWSTYRNGSALIPEALLEAVVRRYVSDPLMRRRQLGEGRRLRQEAEDAARDLDARQTPPRPAPVRTGRHDVVGEALLRLDDARQRQMEAMQKLAASEKRCEQLQGMVSMLNLRCTQLEVERDRAREESRAELQNELQQSLEYRRQADEQLEHARRAQREAQEIRLAAEEQVVREQLALQHLRDGGAVEGEVTPVPVHQGPAFDVPPLDRVAEVLRAAAEHLAVQDQELDSLREQVGLRPVDRIATGPTIVPGHVVDNSENAQAAVVRSKPADNVDNDPATAWEPGGTADPSPSPSALVMSLTEVSTPGQFARHLRELVFQNGWSHEELGLAVFGGTKLTPQNARHAKEWLRGTLLPYGHHLGRMMSALGIAPEEATALHSALSRLQASHSKLMPNSHHRVRDWLVAILTIGMISTLAAAFTAAVQADPGPSVLLLLGAAVVGILLGFLIWLTAAVITEITWKTAHPTVSHTAGWVAAVGGPCSLCAGLILPWILGTDVWGHWLADFVGLL